MASLPPPRLGFAGGCPDPGERVVELPSPLPEIGDDFDWRQRDFESFRDAMLREIAARFPERRRWMAADLEVVLIEALAAVLDQLSDMSDRVASEAYLETARQPESVARWLSFIGVRPDHLEPGTVAKTPAGSTRVIGADPLAEWADVLARWRDNPHEMERARRAGPAKIRVQRRMASLADYAERLGEHPLVERADAARLWTGSWFEVVVTLGLWNGLSLDTRLMETGHPTIPTRLRKVTELFHRERELPAPQWSAADTLRDVLDEYVDVYRCIGQPVVLRDALLVGIDISVCIHLGAQYFQSEVRRDVLRKLGRGPGGFFEPGRLQLAQDLRASDIFAALMALDGVEVVELMVFKKVGSLYANRADRGVIALRAGEIAVCDNDNSKRERGLLRIELQGGRRG